MEANNFAPQGHRLKNCFRFDWVEDLPVALYSLEYTNAMNTVGNNFLELLETYLPIKCIEWLRQSQMITSELLDTVTGLYPNLKMLVTALEKGHNITETLKQVAARDPVKFIKNTWETPRAEIEVYRDILRSISRFDLMNIFIELNVRISENLITTNIEQILFDNGPLEEALRQNIQRQPSTNWSVFPKLGIPVTVDTVITCAHVIRYGASLVDIYIGVLKQQPDLLATLMLSREVITAVVAHPEAATVIRPFTELTKVATIKGVEPGYLELARSPYFKFEAHLMLTQPITSLFYITVVRQVPAIDIICNLIKQYRDLLADRIILVSTSSQLPKYKTELKTMKSERWTISSTIATMFPKQVPHLFAAPRSALVTSNIVLYCTKSFNDNGIPSFGAAPSSTYRQGAPQIRVMKFNLDSSSDDEPTSPAFVFPTQSSDSVESEEKEGVTDEKESEKDEIAGEKESEEKESEEKEVVDNSDLAGEVPMVSTKDSNIAE